MIEYRRVMFFDADIMPNNNLDYLFHFTDYEYYYNTTKNNNYDEQFNLPVVPTEFNSSNTW